MTTRNLHGRPLPGKKRRRQLHCMVADLEREQEQLFAQWHRQGAARPGGRLIEVMPIADALRHPIFGPHVLMAAMAAGSVMTGAGSVRHGAECFTCGERWRSLAREPRSAALGSPRTTGPGFVGLVCEPCMARGLPAVADMVKAVFRDLFGGTDVRGGVVTAPGGRA